jgi:hypothetical protein
VYRFTSGTWWAWTPNLLFPGLPLSRKSVIGFQRFYMRGCKTVVPSTPCLSAYVPMCLSACTNQLQRPLVWTVGSRHVKIRVVISENEIEFVIVCVYSSQSGDMSWHRVLKRPPVDSPFQWRCYAVASVVRNDSWIGLLFGTNRIL